MIIIIDFCSQLIPRLLFSFVFYLILMENNSQKSKSSQQTEQASSIEPCMTVFPKKSLKTIQGEKPINASHSIVAIIGRTDSGKAFCSFGVLLSQNLVLTSAHNVYCHPQQKQNINFRVYHQLTQGIERQYHSVECWKYLAEFQASKQEVQYDYALLKLKEDQKQTISYNTFPKLLVTCPKCFQDKQELNINIYGSHVDEKLIDSNLKFINQGQTQLFHEGLWLKNEVQLVDHKNFIIKYKIITKNGQICCPIIMDNNIIGIHNGGDEKGSIGRLVTVDMSSNILKWSKQLKGDPIEIVYNNQCCEPKAQERAIQVVQQYIWDIASKLQSIPLQEKKPITSLTLKATVTVLQKKCTAIIIKDVVGNQ